MKLAEIFNQLAFGELSQISMGGEPAGQINENNYSNVLAHINLGMTALYKRFHLKEGRITLVLQPGRTTYPLTAAYAVANKKSSMPIRYIADTDDTPFKDDIHKIESVFTDSGVELNLNDSADMYSVRTPSASTLCVPSIIVVPDAQTSDVLKTKQLNIVYRANHPMIVQGIGLFDPTRIEVDLPYSHLEPLLLYVASRVNNPIGMANEFHAGSSYAAKYEQSCQQLEIINLRVDQGSQRNRLMANGWV